jgi:phospholipase/carboxylesterase
MWGNSLPHTAFFAPDAPEPFMPFESGGYRWFDLQAAGLDVMQEGLLKSSELLNEFLDGLLEEFNLTNDRLVLMGFSQGAAMALHVGPRRGNPVMGYSGGVFLQDPSPTFKQVPILLVHGTEDEVLPLTYMQQAEAYLVTQGLTPQTLICPGLGHGIDEAGLTAGLTFLRESAHLS